MGIELALYKDRMLLSQHPLLTEEYLNGFKSLDKIPLLCAECEKDVYRRKSDVMASIKHGRSIYCSPACAHVASRRLRGIQSARIVQCANCGAECKKTPSQLKQSKSTLSFCGRSCSVTYFNASSPKRKKQPKAVKSPNLDAPTNKTSSFCNRCNKSMLSDKSDIMCLACKQEVFDQLTLREAQYVEGPSSKAAKWARIRGRARSIYQHRFIAGCEACSYCKHVDVAHIKSISDFSPETTVAEVNAPKNIAILCRNCHWELDHDLMDINTPVWIRAERIRNEKPACEKLNGPPGY